MARRPDHALPRQARQHRRRGHLLKRHDLSQRGLAAGHLRAGVARLQPGDHRRPASGAHEYKPQRVSADEFIRFVENASIYRGRGLRLWSTSTKATRAPSTTRAPSNTTSTTRAHTTSRATSTFTSRATIIRVWNYSENQHKRRRVSSFHRERNSQEELHSYLSH